jgi:hypothetical protein
VIRALLTAALVVVAILVMAPAAWAALDIAPPPVDPFAPDKVITNVSVATDGVIYASLRPAERYWRVHDYDPPGDPSTINLYYYDEAPHGEGAVARGWLGQPFVWIERGYLARVKEMTGGERYLHNLGLRSLCRVMAHERGHNIGLRHTSDGSIMDPNNDAAPGICRRWAAKMVMRALPWLCQSSDQARRCRRQWVDKLRHRP